MRSNGQKHDRRIHAQRRYDAAEMPGCGESDITIVYTPDKKLRLNVPCFFCPKPHNFLVSRNMFFGRELFTLPCAYSGLDICYIGEEKAVLKAAEEGEKELAELLGESTFDQLSSHRGGDFMTDPQIREIVKFVIQDLSDEGEISCNCEDGEGDYEAEIHDEEITVRCKNAVRSRTFPRIALPPRTTSSTRSISTFTDSQSITLCIT